MIILEPAFTILNPPSPAEARAMLRRVEHAGRVCYKSEDRMSDDSYHRFILMLMQKNHWSVIEHATMTAHIVTNRGVTHELVRHRIASFSQESTRYCNYNKGKFGGEITVVAPRELGGAELEIWRASMAAAEQAYLALIQRGVSPQIARGVLPNDLKAEIVVTANLREWHHLFALRCAANAHPHIRQVMQIGLAQAIELFSPVFDDLRELCGENVRP